MRKQYIIKPKVVSCVQDDEVSKELGLFDSLTDAFTRGFFDRGRTALDGIVKSVRSIVELDSGTIEHDGCGFGIAGHERQFADFMVVTVSEEAIQAIQKMPNVESVWENMSIPGAVTQRALGMK